MHYFSRFSKKFNKPCVCYTRVWTKNTICWKFLKVFDENCIGKLNFYFILIFNFNYNFIFRKFVTKNRAFGNNTSFLQQFFRFRRGAAGGIPPLPPGYALAPLDTWTCDVVSENERIVNLCELFYVY